MQRQRTWATTAIIGAILMVMPPAAAATVPLPPPPPVAQQVQTTNAMLQPADLTGPLASTNPAFATGLTIPQANEDPRWLCRYGENDYVFLPGERAVGYSSSTGRVTQNVFEYRTEAQARAAVRTAKAGLSRHCSGTWRLASWRTRLIAGTIASPGGGADGLWVRSEALAGTKSGNGSSYVYLIPLGNRVSVTWLDIPGRRTTLTERDALEDLSLSLADRLVDQANLAVTQDANLTKGQTVMLQPADVPATLPYQRPAKGGWSGFSANSPGAGQIAGEGTELPGGVMDLQSSVGANEGAIPGSLWQSVWMYADEETARRHWDKVRTEVPKGSVTPNAPLSRKADTYRLSSGVSAAAFDGNPGVWFRTFSATPGDVGTCFDDNGREVRCPSTSAKSYTLYLLVGSTIQSVTYVGTVNRLAEVPLDQAAVDELAVRLAQRWAAG